MTPDDLINNARSYLGTPFRHQGRLPGVALDCVGLIVCSALATGLQVRDVHDYPSEPDGGRLMRELDKQFARLTWPGRPGDVLVMRFIHDPRHVALFTGETIIHAKGPVGEVIEQRFDKRLSDLVVAAFRFREFL